MDPQQREDQQESTVEVDEQADDRPDERQPETPDEAAAQQTPTPDQPADAEADAMAEEMPEPTEAEIDATVEAILFTTDNPLSAGKIAQVGEFKSQRTVKHAIARLNEKYDETGCAFRIEPIADGYQMLTLPEYHDVLSRLFTQRSDSKLSQAALETLAIIAYRQPILRADIESIRGVSSGEMVRKLMEKQLVKIVGRAEVLGRPMLYGTTKRFLDVFGLADLSELPNVEELRQPRQAPQQNPAADEAPEQHDASDADEPDAQEQEPTPTEPDAEAPAAPGDEDR